jgi:hypothetical protein
MSYTYDPFCAPMDPYCASSTSVGMRRPSQLLFSLHNYYFHVERIRKKIKMIIYYLHLKKEKKKLIKNFYLHFKKRKEKE